MRFKRSAGSQELVDNGYSFARSCFEDSKAYIEGAPPDAGHMADMYSLHVWMSVLLYGHKQGPDLQLLQVRSFHLIRGSNSYSNVFRRARDKLYILQKMSHSTLGVHSIGL